MLKPFFVVPFILRVAKHRSGGGSCLGMESVRVGPFDDFAALGFDGEFIADVFVKSVNAAFPYAVAYFMHWVRAL